MRRRKVKNNLPPTFKKNQEEINMELSTLALRLKKLYTDALRVGDDPTIKYVHNHFSIAHDPTAEKFTGNKLKCHSWSIYDYIRDYIETKRNDVARDTVKDYKSLIKHLKGFGSYSRKQINFNCFDYIFYEEFINYLFFVAVKPNKEVGLYTNSVGKQIKNLKAFLRGRAKLGYIKPIDLSYFKTVPEDVDLIYLEKSDIAKIFHLDLSDHPELVPARDWLVLGCLIGLRFSDLSKINPQ